MLEASVQAFSDGNADTAVYVCTPGADPALQALEAGTGIVAQQLRQDVLLALKAVLEIVDKALNPIGVPLKTVSDWGQALSPHYDMTKSGEGGRVASEMYANLIMGKAFEAASPFLRAGIAKIAPALANESKRLGTVIADVFKNMKGAPDASQVAKQILQRAREFNEEVAQAAARSRPALTESGGAGRPGSTRPFTDRWGLSGEISATSKTARSLVTAITADVGESEAYKAALRAGEIGLQRPFGANVGGSDFITAKTGADGLVNIIVTDVKTSVRGKFPVPKTSMPGSWQTEVQNAISRLQLNDPQLAKAIQDAYQAGRIQLRQVNVDYSPIGQGSITGI